MRRLSISARLLIGGLIAAAAAFAVWVIPTDSYIFLPNEAHAVAPLVEVEGGGDPKDGGGIYYVDVLVRKATLLERVWPGFEDGATVVPAAEVRPPGVSEGERRREELAEMRMSQRVAAAVALRELGHDVVAKPTGARIELVDPESPAGGKLRSGDIVIGAGGKPVTAPAELRRAIRAAGSGNELSIVAKRGTENVRLQLRPTQGPEGTPVIGVIVSQAADIKLPLDVEIDTGGVGGPSAGLAFALALMEELGHDVDRGNRIAVTGSLELDGTVGQIGGVKQKTVGVEQADIDYFLVPAGENATEARRYADGIKVIPVTNFQQALRALAKLPQKSQE